MGWKDWPAWLKGGVIGLCILIILWFVFPKMFFIILIIGVLLIILIAIGLIKELIFSAKSPTIKGGLIGLILGILFWFYEWEFFLNVGGTYPDLIYKINDLFNIPSYMDYTRLFLPLIIFIITFFIIGVIIGWIVGKIRNK